MANSAPLDKSFIIKFVIIFLNYIIKVIMNMHLSAIPSRKVTYLIDD